MKIFFFSLILTFTFICQIDAQLRVEPDTIISPIANLDEDVVGHGFFYNDLPQVKTFRWVRKVMQITDGWESAVCDDNQCYLPTVDSIEITLGPLESSVLDVHVYPNEIYEGYAVIEVTVKDVNNPSVSAKAVYIFDSNLTSATVELNSDLYNVFPNPNAGLFSISGEGDDIRKIAIHDYSGRHIKTFDFKQGEWYDFSKAESGTYILRLLDGKNQLRGTKLVNKF
jgi:hypothetical protein